MRILVLAVVVFLVAAAPASAQETAEAPSALERGAALLEGLTGYDESLGGTSEFKVLMGGTVDIGTAKLTVGPAPEGSGAVYQAVLDVKIQMGPQSMMMRESALLRAGFELLSREQVETERGPDGVEVTTEIVNFDGEAWSLERRSGDESHLYEAPAAGPNHNGLLCGMLIAAKLGVAGEGEYAFRGIRWPDPEDEDAPEEPTWREFPVSVGEAELVTISGQEIEVKAIRAVPEDEVTTFHVTLAGVVVEFFPEDAPIRIVAADLASAAPEPGGTTETPPVAAGGAATPRDAVIVYLNVLAAAASPEALDDVMDWSAIHQTLSADDASIAALSVEALAEVMKMEFGKQAGVITPEQVTIVGAMLKVTEEGDSAKVAIPGKEDQPFHLRKAGGGWRITYFPR